MVIVTAECLSLLLVFPSSERYVTPVGIFRFLSVLRRLDWPIWEAHLGRHTHLSFCLLRSQGSSFLQAARVLSLPGSFLPRLCPWSGVTGTWWLSPTNSGHQEPGPMDSHTKPHLTTLPCGYCSCHFIFCAFFLVLFHLFRIQLTNWWGDIYWTLLEGQVVWYLFQAQESKITWIWCNTNRDVSSSA